MTAGKVISASSAPAAAPTADGTYTYDYSGSSSTSSPSSGTATAKVQTTGTNPGNPNQTVTITTPQGTQTEKIAWEPGGEYDLTENFGSDCQWQPAVLDYKVPITQGSSWSWDSSCTVTGPNGAAGNWHNTGTSTVQDLEQVSVGGTAVDVWRINQTMHWTIVYSGGTTNPGGGTATVDFAGITLYAPRYGLPVTETQDGRTTFAGQATEIQVHLQLRSVKPS